jgi:hypothetical protein
MPVVVIAVKCNYCSKQKPPALCTRLPNGLVVCETCLDWHHHALEVLAGAVPLGCSECGASWETLRDSQLGVEVRMYVVPKDGLYGVLCPTCVQPYLPKRSDLYRGTEFGHRVLKA